MSQNVPADYGVIGQRFYSMLQKIPILSKDHGYIPAKSFLRKSNMSPGTTQGMVILFSGKGYPVELQTPEGIYPLGKVVAATPDCEQVKKEVLAQLKEAGCQIKRIVSADQQESFFYSLRKVDETEIPSPIRCRPKVSKPSTNSTFTPPPEVYRNPTRMRSRKVYSL